MKRILAILMTSFLLLQGIAQQNHDPNRDYRIQLLHKQYVPKAQFNPKRANGRVIDSNQAKQVYAQKQYYLIQFYDLPDDNTRAKLKNLGITLLNYVPNAAYYAYFDKRLTGENLNQLDIRSVISLDENFKLSEELHKNQIPIHAKKGGEVELILTLFSNANTSIAHREISKHAEVTAQHSPFEWTIKTKLNKIRHLARIQEVLFLEPIAAEPEPEIDAPEPEYINSNDHGRSNYINTGFDGKLYNGNGINVMVRENGIYDTPDFHGRLLPGTNFGDSPGGHATGVSAFLGSSGNINPRTRSNAWGANILAAGGQNLYALYDNPDMRIRVVNMSYGWAIQAGYSSLSREHDNFIRTRPEAMLVYSSGNSGGSAASGGLYDGIVGWGNLTGEAKHAKNLLIISGTDYEDNFLDWTCKGPAFDGRIKPELTIHGSGGTSHAAPKISGIFTILHQVFKETTQASTVPSALIKAIMMNTADDVHNPGIDFKTGFGRPNVRRAYHAITNEQYFSGTISHGAQNSHNIQVPADTKELRVLLYWHDYEATPGVAKALVNDLDLKVNNPTSQTYLPWVLDITPDPASLNSLPVRNLDRLNNVEQVTIPTPTQGNYQIEINGFNIPEGPQEYYLVYEFIQEELLLTSPLEGETLNPGQNFFIRWDANGDSSPFSLDYSTDNGSTWTNIASNIPATQRQYNWNVPALENKTQIRITRDSQSNITEPIHILTPPSGFQVDWACSDQIQLSWEEVPGAIQYEIFKLGEKYMESIGVTNDTYFIDTTTSNAQKEWYAVRSIALNELTSPRTLSVEKPEGTVKCQSLNNGIALSVTESSATLTGTVNALGKQLNNVVFEYGISSTFSEEFPVVPAVSGTQNVPIEITVPHTMKSGEIWQYRLKGEWDGQTVYSEAYEFSPAPGNSMVFNGNETVILGPNDEVNGNKPRTIEVWVKADAFASDGGVITFPGSTGTTRGDFTFGTDGQENRWKLSLWNVTRFYELPNSKGEWHHIAISYDPSNTTALMYYDGILWDTWNTGEINTLPGNIRLGVRSNGPQFYYKGEMDEVRIWNSVRTADEIKRNMHHPLKGDEENLVYYVNFDQFEDKSYDIVTKQQLTYTGLPLKIAANYPFGNGESFYNNESQGWVSFGNGTGVNVNYSEHSGREVMFSKIKLTSAPINTITPTSTTIGEEYWISKRLSKESGDLKMDIRFKSSADITPEEASSPGSILVFSRPSFSDAKWNYSDQLSYANAEHDSIGINSSSEYTQFLFLKDENPIAFFSVDTLSLADTKVGRNSISEAITISGVMLPDSISVTSTDGFEVSLDDSLYVSKDNYLSVSTVNGILDKQEIYVRFSPTESKVYEGEINLLVNGIATQTLYLEQEALEPETFAGKALSFNGSNSNVVIEDLNWQPTEFTLEWWLKPNTSTNWNQQIGNGWGSFLVHADNAKNLSIGVANNSNSRLTVPGAFEELGTWKHIAYTFQEGNVKVYFNGELIDSKPSSTFPPNWPNFRIGAANNSTINGELDEFRMWTKARTQTEIRENMNHTLTGDEEDLKVYLQFQETSKGIADLSNNGFKITMHNDPTHVDSSVPVAAGYSETKSIVNPGMFEFEGTGLSLEFSSEGTNPNGDVVVSKLHALPNKNVLPTAMDSTYWVVKNYGANKSFDGLVAIKISGLVDDSSGDYTYRLFDRRHFDHGDTWNMASHTTSHTQGEVEFNFNHNNAVDKLGQIAISQTEGGASADTLAGNSFFFEENGQLQIMGLNWQPTSFTIEWWMKANSTLNWNQQFGNGWGSFLSHADSEGHLNIGVANNPNSRLTVTNAFQDLGNWHHFAYTFENGQAKIYMDGTVRDERPNSSLPPVWHHFNISALGNNRIDGELDEFRIWDIARTPEQIRGNMHHTVPADSENLKVYLQGQGSQSGEFITDASNNAYLVKINGYVGRKASSAPVAKGTSESISIEGPGWHAFDSVGLSLNYGEEGIYPIEEAVVSKLHSTPFGLPETDANTYWIVRNYGSPIPVDIREVSMEGDTDCDLKTTLHLRAFNSEDEWTETTIGEYIGEKILFTSEIQLENNQLSMSQTPIAEPLLATIADVYAVQPGGVANTIYWGYGPDSLNLEAEVVGGIAPYTYQWSTGENGPQITVAPETTGTHSYTVIITDARGCQTEITKEINVLDIRCGANKVNICHRNGHTICIHVNAVPEHLQEGNKLGSCEQISEIQGKSEMMNVYPNPASFEVNVEGTSEYDGPSYLVIYQINDLSGKTVIEQPIQVLEGKFKTKINVSGLRNGVYVILNPKDLVKTSLLIKK
ncbi:LamG-like jellyroll fold domain-containing protein [Belliella marina]|uniref:LamG-like jellyroll fold domain-containing protein n=1 Tax=Belliella marina TaxID=1644146 RepID=A0ABW4VK95_9BACT